jgi:hypothetical protein
MISSISLSLSLSIYIYIYTSASHSPKLMWRGSSLLLVHENWFFLFYFLWDTTPHKLGGIMGWCISLLVVSYMREREREREDGYSKDNIPSIIIYFNCECAVWLSLRTASQRIFFRCLYFVNGLINEIENLRRMNVYYN